MIDRVKRRRDFLFRKPHDETRRRALTPREKEEMLAVLIRNPDAFLLVKDKLSVEKMASWSSGYAAVWKVVRNFYNKHQVLPPENILTRDLQALIHHNTGEIQDEELTAIDQFIEYVYDPQAFNGDDITTNLLYQKRAIATAVRFIQESAASTLADRVSIDRGTVPDNMPALLEKYHNEVVAAEAIQQPRDSRVFPDGWDVKKRFKLFSTGFSILDRLLNKQRAGEVYGVLGISGVCKTTLAVKSIVAMAESCAAKEALGETRDGCRYVVFYVTYETDKEEFGERCIACHAGIRRDDLINMDSMESLPGPNDPIPEDDKVKFARQIELGTYVCQRDRAMAAVKLINDYVVFVDYSAMDPDMDVDDTWGTGGIREVASFVQTTVRTQKVWPMVLWLDHISGMINMIEDAPNDDPNKKLHREIAKAAGLSRRLIAKKYECPVWLLHQFNGVSNKKVTGAKLHHTDAEGCKSFANFCDFAICIGQKNSDQMVPFEATKTRRTGSNSKSGVVRIDGEFCQLHDVSDMFVVDSVRQRIIAREELNNAPSKQTKQGAMAAQAKVLQNGYTPNPGDF